MTPEELVEKLKEQNVTHQVVGSTHGDCYIFKQEVIIFPAAMKLTEEQSSNAEPFLKAAERDEAVRELEEVKRKISDALKLVKKDAVKGGDYSYCNEPFAKRMQAILTGEGE